MNIFKTMSAVISFSALVMTTLSTASAITIGTYTPDADSFLQSGSFTNLNASTLTGVIIDLGVDAGSAGAGTPVWDTNEDITLGIPTGTFSNLVPGATDVFFTVSFLGLNVTTGNNFSYTNLDYDGFNGPGFNAGASTLLDGSELVTLLFADGSSVNANLPAGSPNSVGTVDFDDSNLIISAVPVPAALPLFGTGLAMICYLGWRRKRILT